MIETGLGENVLLRVIVLVSTVILITRLALAVRLLELGVSLAISLEDLRIQSLALAFAGGVRNLGGSHCRCYAVMYRVIAHTESLTMERPSASVRMRTRKA